MQVETVVEQVVGLQAQITEHPLKLVPQPLDALHVVLFVDAQPYGAVFVESDPAVSK